MAGEKKPPLVPNKDAHCVPVLEEMYLVTFHQCQLVYRIHSQNRSVGRELEKMNEGQNDGVERKRKGGGGGHGET